MSTRKQKPRPFCYWTLEPQGYTGDEEAWATDCDNLFQFTADGPKENGFAFCPYCGLPTKEKR